jgi:hypothetical protein
MGACLKSYMTGKSRTVRDGETITYGWHDICEFKTGGARRDAFVEFDGGQQKPKVQNSEKTLEKASRKSYQKMDYEKAQKMYDAGSYDMEIAIALGVTKDSVAKWRHRNNLPSNAQTQKGVQP